LKTLIVINGEFCGNFNFIIVIDDIDQYTRPVHTQPTELDIRALTSKFVGVI